MVSKLIQNVFDFIFPYTFIFEGKFAIVHLVHRTSWDSRKSGILTVPEYDCVLQGKMLAHVLLCCAAIELMWSRGIAANFTCVYWEEVLLIFIFLFQYTVFW